MIDSIYTAMSGLQGHQRGLSTISNNVANMNTPGFMGSHVDFSDLFGDGGNAARQDSEAPRGGGLDASRVSLDLRSGELAQTGRDLDLALNGDGFFVLSDEAGGLRYTRNGSFEFDDSGVLVERNTSMKVQSRDADGKLGDIALAGLKTNSPVATSEVLLDGNLSSTGTDHTIDVVVFDKLGGQHDLTLTFSNDAATTPGSWVVTVLEGSKELGSGRFSFTGGIPSDSSVPLTLAFDGTDPQDVAFTLDSDTTQFSSGTTSTLAVKSQNGREHGQISSTTFDENGVLKIAYTNGQSVEGPRLVLAQAQDDTGLVSEGGALYKYLGDRPPALREAGDTLGVTAKSIEQSNVDLTGEFSALILMQRGYQASSQVISTANEMLQQLFEMKGHA